MPEKRKNETQISLPSIRSSASISVNLSSRPFVTPKRESQDTAEREWCAKQYEIMKNRIGFSDTDLSAEERDTNWLIEKGNAFLEKKNYLAAVSAFSCGLNISNHSPELFLGRAKAQYELQNFRRCVSYRVPCLFHIIVPSFALWFKNGKFHFLLRPRIALKLWNASNRPLNRIYWIAFVVFVCEANL